LPGNPHCNSGVGPNYFSTNLRLNKRFAIKRSTDTDPTIRGEFIAEATNVFNKVNYMRVNDTFPGRELQFGFRLAF
jgi:hypothetical protein